MRMYEFHHGHEFDGLGSPRESHGPVQAAGRVPALSDDRERLHAVRSGLAGVAGALHVLLDERPDRLEFSRHRVETLLITEVERLQRLVDTGSDERRGDEFETLDLDDVIEDVVLARTVAGQQVVWEPTGHRVRGRRDVLVELLNILLVNAARHAGTPARIDVSEAGEQIRLTVSDGGPGIPPELREEIFERGARREGSPGEGLGLSMARHLAQALGGSLALCEGQEPGARFDVVLPATALGGAA